MKKNIASKNIVEFKLPLYIPVRTNGEEPPDVYLKNPILPILDFINKINSERYIILGQIFTCLSGALDIKPKDFRKKLVNLKEKIGDWSYAEHTITAFLTVLIEEISDEDSQLDLKMISKMNADFNLTTGEPTDWDKVVSK